MSKEDFAFGKENFILIAISVVIIITGFVLMSGGAAEGASFNPEIFSTRRIVVAPVVCMIGFGLMVAAILKNSKDKKAA
jgi:general stress protein CsbA